MGKPRRLFYALLFVAATLLSALHELSPVHETEADCPVCMVEAHTVALCSNGETQLLPVRYFDVHDTENEAVYLCGHLHPYGSRDPPSLI